MKGPDEWERLKKCALCGWMRVHHSDEGRGKNRCPMSDATTGGFAGYHPTERFVERESPQPRDGTT